MDAKHTDPKHRVNPQSVTAEGQPRHLRRSTARVVIGGVLVAVSLLGLWIGIALTQPNGVIDLSGTGHFFVVVSILVGAAGGWCVVSGMAEPSGSTTRDPSATSEASPSQPDPELRAGDASQASPPRGAARDARLVSSAAVGLAILVGLVVWHASNTPPSMADRVQSATHAKNVSCYDQGEINMGDGTYHPFYDCLSPPPTSTKRPTTVGCYVYYQGRLEDVASRLANHPNSWDTMNLIMAPPSADPNGGNVCGSYAW